MIVALAYDAELPVPHYGGTERVAWWLARGLSELGVRVRLACKPGSRCPFAEVVSPDFSKPLEAQVTADLYHHFVTPSFVPERPYLVTIHGNGKPGETFLRNTNFISRNHAERHQAECFVHNGLDPAEYEFRETKDDYLVFLGKASWRVKNVKGAIRYARRSRIPLSIIGGSRWWLPRWRGVRWEGMLGGPEKAKLLSGAKGLLFPVIWNEPFGLAVIEALVSGTPVVASSLGSLPELVAPSVGFLCRSDDEFLSAIARLPEIKPQACRDWVMEKFHYRRMAESYLKLYERVLAGEALNRGVPRSKE